MIKGLNPKQIVEQLDYFIIGQHDAKKAVAIALRNRRRRMSLTEDPIRDEIHPKNIIMIGPTGVGKTEIARRLAKIDNAPFIKVEATKYTEIGYVGRDVDSMIRDLVAVAMGMVRNEHEKKLKKKASALVEDKILDILLAKDSNSKDSNDAGEEEKAIREMMRKKLHSGVLEDREIEIKTKSQNMPAMQVMAIPGMEDMEHQMQNLLGDLFPKKKSRKKVKILDARKIFFEEEIENLLDFDKIKEEAIQISEESGIIFIDEIDKIANRSSEGNSNISREGVQRDILPLIEGSTVNSKYGTIRTDHILFIAAGAFHVSSVSDLIPELQGRFPIRVELKSLKQDDYTLILQNPKNALSKQYKALLATEGIDLKFTNDGLQRIAEIAFETNLINENIGARRLHTIMEKLLETVSFNSEEYIDQTITIDKNYVDNQLGKIIVNQNLSRYVL